MTPELELIEVNRSRKYHLPCPFTSGGPGGRGECMHCYMLFPGWGDMYIDENCRRSLISADRPFYNRTSCPCYVFGKSFVIKTVNEMFAKAEGIE